MRTRVTCVDSIVGFNLGSFFGRFLTIVYGRVVTLMLDVFETYFCHFRFFPLPLCQCLLQKKKKKKKTFPNTSQNNWVVFISIKNMLFSDFYWISNVLQTNLHIERTKIVMVFLKFFFRPNIFIRQFSKSFEEHY